MANYTTEINGIDMYYEIHGEGRPLFLIHGGGSTINSNFGRLLPLLAANNKVIAVEMQAHGRTPDRDTDETFEQDAKDIIALMDYLKIPKASVLGFSNGGHTCMELGVRHASRIQQLIIMSAFYKQEGAIPGLFQGLQMATIDNMPAYLKEAYLAVNPDEKGLLRMFQQDKKRMLNFTGWSDDEIRSITAPTLVIAGDRDVVIPRHLAEMTEKINGSRLCILPGNHGSFIGEGPAANSKSVLPSLVATVINEFLNGELDN